MSEHAESRFKERENLNILLGKREVGESSSDQNSPWTAHWTKRTQNKRVSIPQSQNTRTRVAERLVIGMNRRTTTNSNLLSTSTNENFGFYFNSVSSNIEACEVLEGSDHFPMYGIKRKIETILNPKKGKARFEDRVSELNVAFHSSKEMIHFESTHVQNPNFGSCSCSEEGNFFTRSQIKCPSHNTGTISMNLTDSSSGYSKKKTAFLFEMVSLPSESYDMAQCRSKSKSCEENLEWDWMISNLRNVEGQFEKCDALLLDNTKAIGSMRGLASSRAEKVMRSNFTATAFTGKSLTRDKHIESLNTNLDPGPSRTVSMDSTEILPKSSAKAKLDSNFTETQQKPSNEEVHGDRWLKRLGYNLKPKRFKLENNNNNSPSQVSEQKVKSWIQRWCGNKKLPSERGEKFGVVPGEKELEEGRLFPSIAAMAMMGKALNKLRPGEFQRRGPSVVWNNNDL